MFTAGSLVMAAASGPYLLVAGKRGEGRQGGRLGLWFCRQDRAPVVVGARHVGLVASLCALPHACALHFLHGCTPHALPRPQAAPRPPASSCQAVRWLGWAWAWPRSPCRFTLRRRRRLHAGPPWSPQMCVCVGTGWVGGMCWRGAVGPGVSCRVCSAARRHAFGIPPMPLPVPPHVRQVLMITGGQFLAYAAGRCAPGQPSALQALLRGSAL